MKYRKDLWQPLHWNEWRDTANTVHLFTQIIGKIRLALMPMQAEWAQVPLTLTSSGIASLSMPVHYGSVDIIFDFMKHELLFNASDARSKSFPLKDKSVAGFYKETIKTLDELDVQVKINPMSVEMKTAIKMDTDEEHKTYDEKAVRRWWHLQLIIGNIFNEFRSRFSGKVSPVNFFWGSFDLSITFFSGKFLDPRPEFDLIYRVAMDAEQATIGFWPGNDESPEPIFFAYTYPKPDGYEKVKVMPVSAVWSNEKGEFILPYESIREDDPGKSILEFCESSYNEGVRLAGWDLKLLEHKPPVAKPKNN
ncbi:MAG: hypothetical protein IPL53_02885 [Ignavibacteria bacterium]|nr:hypothetical protein [Ignavibacteria bacterium]